MNNLEFIKKTADNEKFLEILKICYSIIFFYCIRNKSNQKYHKIQFSLISSLISFEFPQFYH